MRNSKLLESERTLGGQIIHRRPPRGRESPTACTTCADCGKVFGEREEIVSHGTHGTNGVRRNYYCRSCWEKKFFKSDISDSEVDEELLMLDMEVARRKMLDAVAKVERLK